MNKFFGTAAERRHSERTKLVEIAYIGMGPENGGLVLDVSDGGLSFHAVAPVQPSETINFLLSLKGQSRIEGCGQVVWTNEMRTVCGMKFTSLSSGAREHLANWTNQSRQSVPAQKKTLAASEQALNDSSIATEVDPNTEPLFAIAPAPEFQLSQPAPASMWQEPAFFWIAGLILCVAVSIAAYTYGLRVGRSEASSTFPEAMTGAAQPDQTLPLPPVVPAPLNSSPSSQGAQANSNTDEPLPAGLSSSPAVATTGSNGEFQNASRTENATVGSDRPEASNNGATQQNAESGKIEYETALADLNAKNGKRDPEAAVRLLWSAVANGNSAAEVTLADLYIYGEGVAKNCEQGRVLLRAASKSGNPQASIKLADLIKNGCQQ